jgi:hypothetical protein
MELTMLNIYEHVFLDVGIEQKMLIFHAGR